MLRLHGISKTYRTDAIETAALVSVNIEIEAGEFVAVMGPSGCGKSTLLNIMGLLDTPDAGRYEFLEHDVTRLDEARLVSLRKHHIGFIFQNFNLVDDLSVEENIELALLYRGIGAKARRRQVAEVMDQVGIAHRARHWPGQLSGGQQQQVAVARAVVGGRSLILADEPTGNLDSAHGRQVMQLLRALNNDGVTIVMVTHSAANADSAHRTINLFDGQVVTESLRDIC